MKYQCMKCGNEEFEVDEFSATGGLFARLFDIQNRKFTTITCTKCHFAELYKGDTTTVASVVDFIVST